ncbi:MAG: peptidyl-tRNA hydrolase Pth2 [Methanobacteriota archaeon]
MVDFEYKMVLVVRMDLKLSPGKLAVQVAHAAVACSLLTKKEKPIWFSKWQREGAKKAVVKVAREDEFYPLKEKAETLGIITDLVVDAGLTEIAPGTKTALGLGPAPSTLIDQVTGELPLV